MRRPCSTCGMACNYSTWKSDCITDPVTCKACQASERRARGYPPQYPQYHGTTSAETTFPQQQRVSTTLHLGIREPNQLQASTGPNLDLTLSLPQVQGTYAETRLANKERSSSSWNPRGVQKRRRSNLAEHRWDRFAKTLLQSAIDINMKDISDKYDDDLIYEKNSNFISHNEIGTGAALLSPSVASTNCCETETEFVQVKTEPYTGDDSASSNLFDVPIISLSDSE